MRMSGEELVPQVVAARVLSEALKHGGELAETYVEDRQGTDLSLEDSRVEEAVRGLDREAGIRVFYGGLAAYAHTDGLSEAGLPVAAGEAASAASRGNDGRRSAHSRG